MANRTATTKWRNLRRRLLSQAQASGLTNCPLCNTTLDYTTGLRPNSATPDHIEHWANGGTDTPDNIQIICRHCNSKDGGKLGRAKQLGTTTQHVTNITF